MTEIVSTTRIAKWQPALKTGMIVVVVVLLLMALVNVCIYLSINLSINRSIHLSIHQFSCLDIENKQQIASLVRFYSRTSIALGLR